jgi:hypothetical protein
MDQLVVKCAYCKREDLATNMEWGPNTGLPYCSDENIKACNSEFGRLAGHLDVRDWKATVVAA